MKYKQVFITVTWGLTELVNYIIPGKKYKVNLRRRKYPKISILLIKDSGDGDNYLYFLGDDGADRKRSEIPRG